MVRDALSDEFDFIRELGGRTFRDAIGEARFPTVAQAQVGFETMLMCINAYHHRFLIATVDDVPVGFSLLITNHPYEPTMETQTFIMMLSVDPKSRNRGIGAALTEASERVARDVGHRYISACVAVDNLGAQALTLERGWSAERIIVAKRLDA